MNKRVRSLGGRIIKIVTFSMTALLLFQILTLLVFLRDNDIRKKEYVIKTANSIATSLNTLGRSLTGMGRYISNFEAFQDLYIKERTMAEDPAGSVAAAFHTVRFMVSNFPLVLDVIVVPTNGVPFSYFSGMDYEIADTVSERYDLRDPFYIESKYIYFQDRDYFAYVTPISNMYTTTIMTRKFATCIFLCDISYITDLIGDSSGDASARYAVFDSGGDLIASSGGAPLPGDNAYPISADAQEMGLTVRAYGVAPSMDASISMFIYFIVFSVLILISIMILVILLLQRQIALPISRLVREMSGWEGSSLRKRLDSSQIREIDQLLTGFNSMLDEIESNTRKIFSAQEKLYEMEVRKNETEIYALQSQINPHFLFNTLQCIRSIAIMKRADDIAQISLSMAEMFRYSMNFKETVSIREEIEMIKHYVRISDIRFQGRFQFLFHVDEEILDVPIGRMMLQPLVENSLMHGVSKLEEGGVIDVRGWLEGGEVFLTVSDNGPGPGAAELEEIMRELSTGFAENLKAGKSKSFGLYNINRRLKLQYGEQHGVTIRREGGRTEAGIRIPPA